MDTPGTIFIVENDRKTRDLISAFLKYQGYDIAHATPASNIFDTLHEKHIGIVIADLKLLADIAPDFIEEAKKINPLLVLIGYSSNAHINPANEDNVFLLSKPLNLDELESLVMRAREFQTMKTPHAWAAPRAPRALCSSIIGKSSRMAALFELIEKIAASNATVLIQGESGTGKELAARAIHQLSSRSDKNFVPINCAAIPEDLIESELFGHVKGSFTGAYANRAGRFEMADKGTLFLDEIGDMKANLQVKLLRVLQSKEFEPVGSTKSQKVDVRIIAASNKKLEELVESQDFREDLFYRLSVIPITIPPLRERREDIPLLIDFFLDRFNGEKRHEVTGFSSETLGILCAYDWPGNVRELENLVERLVILKDSGLITPDDLPEKYLARTVQVQAPAIPAGNAFPETGICLNSVLDEFENRLILQALERTRGNKKEAAMLLNLKRTTLIEKLKKKNLAYDKESETQ
ncbi:sigma-54-dependent Fis family transcriptional regulator [Oryzomonas sagensis]|uniref:Sigma-54-dependent Fis family transcriptional regulator n=1 Tax=Oryzomonas sagensis TaxID=2603857 RepID=A0ABQ6TU01_9BACT|nr:sigma-54 dependent transcriptional regulator [Oryzomonas sagensis]KAB0672294.1 sigma-54-dependent Fis family transcriptional regulator [Oryzomonas sagensis]